MRKIVKKVVNTGKLLVDNKKIYELEGDDLYEVCYLY